MSYLDKQEADRIVTTQELAVIGPIIRVNQLAIRCNKGRVYQGGAGYNISTDDHNTNIKYATALYASVCFSQETIHREMDQYDLLLLKHCALTSGETYEYKQGDKVYKTFPKSHALGGDATVVYNWNMNDSAITLSRRVVEQILGLREADY